MSRPREPGGSAGRDADDPAHYDPARYDPALYDPPRYDSARYDPARYDPAAYDDSGSYRGEQYDSDLYDPDRYDPDRYDPDRARAEENAGWGRSPVGGWGAPTEPEYAPGPRAGGSTRSSRATRSEPHHPPPWTRGRSSAAARRAAARRQGRLRLLVAGLAALAVVAVLVLGFVVPGWFVTRVLDPVAVQTGVAKIFTDDYGVDGVADVRCPDQVEVVTGATFTCTASIDGDPVTVPVRVTDGDGGYQVGRPT